MPRTQGPWNVHDLWNNNPCVENGGVYEIEEAHYDVKERLEAGSDVEGVIKGNARLIAQSPEMYALLKELEWSQFAEGGGDTRCPVCKGDGYPAYKHEPDCRLAAVLKAVEGEDAR